MIAVRSIISKVSLVTLISAMALLVLGSRGETQGRPNGVADPGDRATPAQNAPLATFTALYSFGTIFGDATNPNYGSFVQGRDGLLYDNSVNGGVSDYGTLYTMTPSGTENIIYSFVRCGFDITGCNPQGGVTLGGDGNFYGTAERGGTGNIGTVYQFTAGGTVTVLHNFMGTGDGGHPFSPPVQGNDGNFYGTTTITNGDFGQVYKITTGGVFTTLHVFTNTPDGDCPQGLVLASDGNFYGTTYYGGTNGQGTVYKITSSGTLTIIHSFDGATGSNPNAQLVQGTDGKLYGVTSTGGTGNSGVVFRIATSGASYAVLHNLNGTTDGSTSYAPLVQATDGNFYGTASKGGSGGDGTIFKMTPAGAYSVVHAFIGSDGNNPQIALYQDTNGIMYSATLNGGTNNVGEFYSLNIGAAPFARLMPTSGKVGSSIGIFGQGFTGATAVSFGGTPAVTFNVVSDTYLTATVPVGALTGTVTVSTPGGPLASNQQFKVTPTITHLAPAAGPQGTTVTITGTGLTQTTGVTFNKLAATTFQVVNDSKVTAVVPSGAETGKVGITTAGGTATSMQTFKVTPTIASFSPPSGLVGVSVTITGTGLMQTSAVTFGGVSASFSVGSDSSVMATVPTGALTGPIGITTPGGTTTSSSSFDVTPAIISFTPNHGPVGTPVMITGNSLTQTTAVTFNGVAATTVTVNSDTMVTADVPTGAVTGKIAITTAGGTATSTQTFHVN